MKEKHSIVMLGATGAVGTEVVKALLQSGDVERLTLLGRRPLQGIDSNIVRQETIDVLDPESYQAFLAGHDTAICTLGIGEPSKVSKEQYVRIDKIAALDFARLCRQAAVKHFEILTSVGSNPDSKSFYLRTKGELETGLSELQFQRLSIFQPSMILTPSNRYGVTQAITLAVWPWLSHLLIGGLSKYRGIKVDRLGRAIAMNALASGNGEHRFQWKEF